MFEIELEFREGAIARAGHRRGHVAGAPRAEPLVETARIRIGEELDDPGVPAPRLVERVHHQRASDAGAMRGRLDPHVLQVPARAAILERAHADNRPVALGDPHVVRFEIAGDDRELRIPLAHPARRVPPVRLGAMRQIRQRIRVVFRGAAYHHRPRTTLLIAEGSAGV